MYPVGKHKLLHGLLPICTVQMLRQVLGVYHSNHSVEGQREAKLLVKKEGLDEDRICESRRLENDICTRGMRHEAMNIRAHDGMVASSCESR